MMNDQMHNAQESSFLERMIRKQEAKHRDVTLDVTLKQ